MILACHNLNKAFGEHTIVCDGSFHIEDREKAALVGINGAGKSTILKMIIGEEPLDGGDVILAKGKTLGYLAQRQDLTSGNTIYEEVKSAKADIFAMEAQLRSIEQELKSLTGEDLKNRLDTYNRLQSEYEAKNGYACESEITGVLKGLGFTEDDFSKQTDTLSGGQKTRVSLGKLLLTSPDILLLDEPTNHLDLSSIAWLETYLLNYSGAVLIVSHDRYFLNRVVTKVIEVDQAHIRMYMGNYKAYAAKKQQIRDARLKEYMNQQREIKHQQAVIEKLRSFNREKSIKRAESREKMLDRITPVEKPVESIREMHFSLEPSCISGSDVLTVEHLSKRFDSQQLFQDISFEIHRGEHVAIIGDNGTGKTTLLKIINQVVSADEGSFTLGSKVKIGYYDQEHQLLHMEKTIFEEISDAYPGLNNTKIRNVLAAFLFTNDDVFKRISDLSGGERGRVSLAKLMLSDANFLILDEPTNHLDITSKEILESALNQYTGTVFFVSHDRYFINQTATRILELTGETVVNYIGNYDYYLEKHDIMTQLYVKPQEISDIQAGKQDDVVNKLDWQAQKAEQARIRKIENSLKKIEDEIAALEEEISAIDEECAKPENAVNSAKLNELAARQQECRERLETCYETWEDLSMQLDGAKDS